MGAMLEDLEDTGRNLRVAVRDSEQFWITHHYAKLTQHDPKKKFIATLIKWLKQEAGLGVVMFEDTGFERKVKVDKRQRLGARINLRVKEADPFRDRLTFVHLKK